MGRRNLGDEANGRATLASSIYEQIRDEIVTGALAPGEKLRIEQLKQRYDLGTSPIREALNRLSMEKLVVQFDQRGFVVAPVSQEDLHELTDARCSLYGILIPRSLEQGDTQWEENIVICLHRLNRAQWLVGDPARLNPAARMAHRDFHRSIIAAAGSRPLVDFMDTLFDFSERYRLLAQQNREAPHRPTSNEHAEMADAAINRRTNDVLELCQTHVRRTAALVDRLFEEQGLPGSNYR